MSNSRKQRGVTLVELMIVIAIAAIFAVIAIPSMTDFVRTTRITSVTSQLNSDMNFAKSEAVKRNTRVLICPANNTNTDCNATASWSTAGWLVCYDNTNDATDNCDATSTANPNPIQIRSATDPTVTVTGPAVAVRFNPIGSQGVVGNTGVTLTVTGTWAGAKSRTISVAGSGSITSN